jgi:hypothetical protein
LYGQVCGRLHFVELCLHRHAVAERLQHNTAMLSCGLQHLHFFQGHLGSWVEMNLTTYLLESERNISVNEQGATALML